MLRELRVRGLGVLTDVAVEFGPGLNVVTGETGAGKTLLVTSLALLTGAKADQRAVAGPEAVVEAIVTPPGQAKALLAERGLDPDDPELILARRVGGEGRSRCWVNGSLVPVGVLAELGRALVEIHGQGEGFALARPQAQLDALDAFAGAAEARATWQAALARVRELRKEMEALDTHRRERALAVDGLVYQVEEIERAALDPDTDERLDEQIGRLEHAERLQETGAQALALIGSDGASAAIGQARRLLRDASRLDPSLAPAADRLEALEAEVDDASSTLRAWADGLDPDPARLEGLRERAALVARLKRKYGATAGEILAFLDDARRRLDELRTSDRDADTVGGDLARAEAELVLAGEALSELRRQGADRLAAVVGEELPALALPSASFEVLVTPGPEGASGRDEVVFAFSANASLPAGPIGKVASGGELSRVMIAVTLALARAYGVPALVFDEADAGVGGQAALDLARRLARLARSHQVLVVTHLPQIAAFADRHLVVSKTSAGVDVRACDGAERVAEVSRMLAGLGASQRARAHAAELLELARAEGGHTRGGRRGRVVAEAV